MSKINLNSNQFQLLNKIICKSDIDYDIYSVTISVNEDNREKIIESLSNYFMKKGLSFNDEPNMIGDEIEKLLDKFID